MTEIQHQHPLSSWQVLGFFFFFSDSVLHLQKDKPSNKCIADWRLANCSSSPEFEKCSHSDVISQPPSGQSQWGASSISIRNVSMGVSPISLKKKRCSRHLSPMERNAGSLRRSLANLGIERENGISRIYLFLNSRS